MSKKTSIQELREKVAALSKSNPDRKLFQELIEGREFVYFLSYGASWGDIVTKHHEHVVKWIPKADFDAYEKEQNGKGGF